MTATPAEDELQWLFKVISCEPPSLNVPVAVNCCLQPTLSVTFAGVIAIDTRVPVPTVSVVVPFTPDADAEIVTEPLFLP